MTLTYAFALAAVGWFVATLFAALAFYYWSWIGRWRVQAEQYLQELRMREQQLQSCAKRQWDDDCWDCPTIPERPRDPQQRLLTQIVKPFKWKKKKRRR